MIALKTTHKRMRPALGTFVEMEIFCDIHGADFAFDRAFQAIEEIESKLSYFKSGSEVAHFNRLIPGETLLVSEDFITVLKLAAQIYSLSNGAFDISQGAGQIFEVSAKRRVLKTKPGEINLGGIAKGFAVDRAVGVLQSFASAGLVNGGGDLRIFGDLKHKIYFRVPAPKETRFYDCHLSEGALATSSSDSSITGQTVSVFAPTCVVADSLTKVILYGSTAVQKICLKHFGAQSLQFKNEAG